MTKHVVHVVAPSEARARLAAAWLGAARDVVRDTLGGARPEVCVRVGSATLRPHQVRALTRARCALAEHRGVLLADATGLGKTHVALALAGDAANPLVVAPAALREMWRGALADAGIRAPFVSMEALSRASPPCIVTPDFVIVDEAHHARTTSTRRHRRLAELAASARVVLLSATPVHNRRRDVVALLSLFLGRRAGSLTPHELARVVVRRRAADVRAMARDDTSTTVGDPLAAPPRVSRPRWHRVRADPAVLCAIRTLPPALPPRDGGDGSALVRIGLARCWASSAGALRTALRRRLALAAALDDALAQGRHATRAELRAWTLGDDAQQLALPLLVTASGGETDVGGADAAAMRAAVATHARAVRSLLALVAGGEDADLARAALLRAIRHRHAGGRIVAFAQHAATVATLFRHLVGDGGVAALTADGGRIVSGRVSRRELLARFAPRSHATPRDAPHDGGA